jgi:hypothetical protein
MSTHLESGFRISPWPGSVLPEEPVGHLPFSWDDDWLFFADDEPEWQVMEEELVLRQLPALDIRDPSAVDAFMSKHGMIGRRLSPLLEMAWTEPVPAQLPRGAAAHRGDITALLAGAKAMVDHNIARYEAGDVVAAWTRQGFQVVDAYGAECLFTDALNLGLSGYTVRVELNVSTPLRQVQTWPGAEAAFIGGESRWHQPKVGLYEGLCLQLYNWVVEHLQAKVCKNEKCRRLFVRQIGRANRDQRRTVGVDFCTSNCANAQAQREYQRRQRVAGKGKGKGK